MCNGEARVRGGVLVSGELRGGLGLGLLGYVCNVVVGGKV